MSKVLSVMALVALIAASVAFAEITISDCSQPNSIIQDVKMSVINANATPGQNVSFHAVGTITQDITNMNMTLIISYHGFPVKTSTWNACHGGSDNPFCPAKKGPLDVTSPAFPFTAQLHGMSTKGDMKTDDGTPVMCFKIAF